MQAFIYEIPILTLIRLKVNVFFDEFWVVNNTLFDAFVLQVLKLRSRVEEGRLSINSRSFCWGKKILLMVQDEGGKGEKKREVLD